MKKSWSFVISLIFVVIVVSGCSNSRKLEGDWCTVAIVKEGINQEIIPSEIKFRIENNKIKVSGDAGVNLFKAKIDIKGNSIKFSNMENTGFMGTLSEMAFEDMFFRVLMNSNSWKIVDDMLFLYATSEKMEIRLKRK